MRIPVHLTTKIARLLTRLSQSWQLANAVLVLSLLAVLAVAVSSQFANPERHGFDLRNRIVGARLLDAGLDPYRQLGFYANGENPIPAWTDPFAPCLTGIQAPTTVPPPGLRLYQIADSGSWTVLVRFWRAVNWLLLGAVVIGFGLTAKTPMGRIVAAILLGPVLLESRASVAHNDVVQLYLFIGALFSLDVLLVLRSRGAWAGWASGLAAIFRPTLLVALPVFWLLGHRRAAMQGGVIAVLLLGGSFLAEAPLWASFLRNTDQWVAFTMSLQKDDKTLEIATQRQAACFAKNTATAAVALKDGYDFQSYRALQNVRGNLKPAKPWHDFAITRRALNALYGGNWHHSAAIILIGLTALLMALAWTVGRRRGGRLAGTVLLAAVPLLAEYANPITHTYVAMANIALFGVACFAVGDQRHRSVLVAMIGCFWFLLSNGNPYLGVFMQSVLFVVCLLAVFPKRDTPMAPSVRP